ncbi:MAG: hypothetical protein ACFB2X_19770 [Rivularia sp. (in: cyanobacteria)]
MLESIVPVAIAVTVGGVLNCNYLLFSGIDCEALVSIIEFQGNGVITPLTWVFQRQGFPSTIYFG